jgi:hypothetical protein
MDMKDKQDIIERFLSFILVDGECCLWNGVKNSGGYGYFSINGKMREAHRVSYELFVGPLDPSLTLDHLCHRRSCVNPKHLEQVTQKENSLRGNTINRHNHGKTSCPQGHDYNKLNTYVCPKGQRHCRICGRAANKRYKANVSR